ncbi:acyl-CoA synthetase (AMP-forming)/AMP-acid ligase II [Streptomyces sp. SAI-117]|jgi:acyl-CoA synthetase (AMP-forming)/AMP-acid ligase II|uniref:class I adenylate-forming enzyme family protein n=1 Tax=unclassified Streptomyces TaxID=2593676 RepID=UPI002474D120|nr:MULTISPECIES: AMP-binding protein [unclassified Streptomyces]MDH6574189.1 acyl-CoA synthetase (AMP-forming)/AMP-acid ligase II [Streptomyces sp. SAI-117]MDH6581076.1 acyl-CoA synthetase (AMP-forming)/AMP-acid ligase II [Streptomyces sp. SAI-133]
MAITQEDTLLTPELIERYTSAGYWSDTTLADVFRRNAQEFPDKVAYIDGRSEVTWGALWQISGEVASGLARRGVERGDVVAVQLPNRIEFVHVLAAVVRLGAVICQYPPDYRAREIEFILGFSEAHTVVMADRWRDFDYTAMIDGIRGDLPRLVNTVAVPMGDTPAELDGDRWITLDQLRADPDPHDLAPDRPSGANDVMRISFTSGTTGEPKAVIHTANTTLFTIQKEIEERGVNGDFTLLVLLPVGLNAGFFALLEAALAGCRIVLMEKFRPAALLDLVERYQVNSFIAAPTALIAILNEESLDSRDLSSLRVVETGGSSTPTEVLRAANERLGCPVVDLYGMLESGITACTSPDEPYQEWVGTVGRPYPWMEVRVLDSDDQDVPVGTEGEIVKSGPAITVGYYRNPAKNQESWTADGWFRSGDRGCFGVDGRLTISGRSKDMIIHGGANIWPRELEEVLTKHPDVVEVAVIGIHNDYFGENVCACLVPRPGTSPTMDDVISFMQNSVAKYKLPQHVELFESFPLGPTGKVLKRELAEEAERRRKAAAAASDAAAG